MSLYLNGGTVPKNLPTKSVGHSSLAHVLGGEGIHIGEYCLSMQDFCALVVYVLTNTNLVGDDDPRVKLIDYLKEAKIVPGYESRAEDSEKPKRFAVPGYDD